jgi:hypothetical protein
MTDIGGYEMGVDAAVAEAPGHRLRGRRAPSGAAPEEYALTPGGRERANRGSKPYVEAALDHRNAREARRVRLREESHFGRSQ